MSVVMVSRLETVYLEADGSLTLPPWVLQACAFQPRQELVVLPVEGTLVLAPRGSVVLEASQVIAELLAKEGVTQEELLAALPEERRRYNRERYPDVS